MKKTLEVLVNPEWKSGIEKVNYKIFWLRKPHCSEAITVKTSEGLIYKCVHAPLV